MEDASLRGGFQCFGNLPHDVHRCFHWNATSRYPVGPASPPEQVQAQGNDVLSLLQIRIWRRCWNDSATLSTQASRWNRATRSAVVTELFPKHLMAHSGRVSRPWPDIPLPCLLFPSG